jgi:signal transduction histidine kinase
LYRSQVATFTVSDTGSGIPADDLPVIFEPFQRGAGEQSKLAPGLGLGLTITRLLTQTLGGEITVESEHRRRHGVQGAADALWPQSSAAPPTARS